jgi:hypothetical protein
MSARHNHLGMLFMILSPYPAPLAPPPDAPPSLPPALAAESEATITAMTPLKSPSLSGMA